MASNTYATLASAAPAATADLIVQAGIVFAGHPDLIASFMSAIGTDFRVREAALRDARLNAERTAGRAG